MSGPPPRPRVAVAVAIAVLALAAVPGCSSSSLPSFFERHTLPFGGRLRSWYSYRPAGAKQPGPVLVMLHGFHEAATDIPGVTGVVSEADRDGFTIVVPEGVDLSWNAGTCCGPAARGKVDDVGFIAAVIAALTKTGIADGSRVYLAGFSNGAMMAYTFACSRPELLAGAAVVEGTLTSTCAAHTPLDLLVVHQTADPVVPLNGTPRPPSSLTPTGPFPPVESALQSWLISDGCGRNALPALPPAHHVARAVLSCPGPTITEFEILGGGGHTWPKGPPLDVTTDLARFFRLTAAR